ncbi:hypothetical protein [Halobacillus amylolyticus]|uniref:DUF4163 domain-containing protein n=1 Tax=Halobacillus amylolyticus TaxID=2932259 RepID=A0ABY4HFG8_9BACI|nr:hypothetical protein [Halobacillus amylolyticus]UOR13629.1 hypothetical protein MUO15_09370 [Halobacillus amylolyticus]
MKKTRLIFLGLLFLCACSTAEKVETDDTEKTSENDETTITTYEFKQEQDTQDKRNWLAPHTYQLTVDDSFERISKYVISTTEERMFFWHQPSANEFQFTLETTTESLQKEVPTIDIRPMNKNSYVYMQEYFSLGEDFTEAEIQEITEDVTQKVEEKSEEHIEEMKDNSIERLEGDPTVYTNKDYDLKPFTYMVEHESEQGVIYYELFGKLDKAYVQATLSIPPKMKEKLFEPMLASVKTMTYKEEEFKNNPVLDEPTQLSYEPAENLKVSYPEVGYSFEIPEAATFRYSFPTFHTYRYTFDTIYEESIEREHFSLNSSELIVRVAKQENARNREEEMRTKQLSDFVAYQHDYARSITYLHEKEGFETGVFTTGVRVEFDGYEEYWFLTEVDGHVYEVTFDIAFDAPKYDELLESYLKVVRSFELTNLDK